MANLLKPRKASHDVGFEGFDLSHSEYFTSSVGHILPIHYDVLLPNDKISIRTLMLSRMNPMLSSSPLHMREHVDYYFVPLETICNYLPSLLSDTNEDLSSTRLNVTGYKIDRIPLVKLSDTMNWFWNNLANYSGKYEFDAAHREIARLVDMFNLGYHNYLGSDVAQNSFSVNPLLLCAYQAVWQYFFRDDSRLEFDPWSFNIDSYFNQEFITDNSVLTKYFQLNYRAWKKDPYTINSVSPLGGEGSLNHFGVSDTDKSFSSFVKQWLTDLENIKSPDVSNPGGFVGASVGRPVNGDSATDTVFSNRTKEFDDRQSLQQHRIAQAIEKLSAIWMQSGKNYQEIMANLFGAKVRPDNSRPMYIGSNYADFAVNEEMNLTSTVDAEGQSLSEAGQLLGRGFASNAHDGSGGNIEPQKFTAPCHGILLALFSIVPESSYRSDFVDSVHTYSKRADFPNPVTDELGERPLFGYEINFAYATPTAQYGWIPRFHELKLKANRLHSGFKTSFAYWMPSRDFDNRYLTSWQSYYIRPDYINSVMVKPYQTSIPLDPDPEDPSPVEYARDYDYFENDPFMHFFRIECHKASKMSSYGVPKTYFG